MFGEVNKVIFQARSTGSETFVLRDVSKHKVSVGHHRGFGTYLFFNYIFAFLEN